MNTIKEKLERCFALVLPLIPRSELPGASKSSIAEWDSLVMVNLLSLIEEEFGIQVPDGDLENFISFELILDYLKADSHDT
ncbi:MAG: acyl carrier protein [Deltaproteobacteria bacterium]|nr:acyl carrier protein [Deltaproteobacteria bacterium]